ncbi:MAG: hypothetical protein KBD53_06505 [Candidatus Omnitrophica bacterium]|nr:hypothetical protein [Candidatus Omnitrophota bacterium]
MKKYNTVLGFITLFLLMQVSSVFAGTIRGTVKYNGEAPKLPEIKMDADPICLTKNTGAVYSQILLLGEGNTLGNVFVHVVGGLSKKAYPAPAEPVILDQKGCIYEPRVIGVMVGQTLKVLNSDGTLHNVHGLPKVNQEFNIAMPKFRTEITKVFDKPEFMFGLKCDVHPWMGAWVAVMDQPFFSVSKKDGQFAIENLPAGQYEIEAWHEKMGTQKISVTLAEGETKEVAFSFSKPQ